MKAPCCLAVDGGSERTHQLRLTRLKTSSARLEDHSANHLSTCSDCGRLSVSFDRVDANDAISIFRCIDICED